MSRINLIGNLGQERVMDLIQALTGCVRNTENLITLESNHPEYAWFVEMQEERLLAGSMTGTSGIYMSNLQYMQLISPPPNHDSVVIQKGSGLYIVSATVTENTIWHQKMSNYLT